MKITAVLIVKSIEKSLEFWVGRLAFDKIVEVSEGDALGFVILTRGNAELMLQSDTSVRKDLGGFAPENLPKSGCTLFIEVDDFEDVKNRLNGYPIEMNERVSSYGMREIGVYEPGGHVVIFAAPAKQP